MMLRSLTLIAFLLACAAVKGEEDTRDALQEVQEQDHNARGHTEEEDPCSDADLLFDLTENEKMRHRKQCSAARNMQEEMTTPSCLGIYNLSVLFGLGPGWPEGIPGDGRHSGHARFGMPDGIDYGETKQKVYKRKAWHTLTNEEKEQYVRGVMLLKETRVGDTKAGAARANYNSFCGPASTTKNLFDYYVELHWSTYGSWGTALQSFYQRAHQGPHFLPWHRYVLLRFEADLRDVLGDDTFALPYWDYDYPESPFDEYLGSGGGCDENGESFSVTDGLLYDLGFRVEFEGNNDLFTQYNPLNLNCIEPRPLQRAVGCGPQLISSTTLLETSISGRHIYDIYPYDSCQVDEDVSFRQYLEGFAKQDDPFAPIDPRMITSILAGTGSHADAHLYVGADLGEQAAPDPLFFLLHANIDRIWSMWQENNLQGGRLEYFGNPGYPTDFADVPLFNFPQVRADEMMDFTKLGMCYDTNSICDEDDGGRRGRGGKKGKKGGNHLRQ